MILRLLQYIRMQLLLKKTHFIHILAVIFAKYNFGSKKKTTETADFDIISELCDL